MARRLKVLMSAYACEPGKGSEPEVGWQWALQMARFHDVTVLTRANNRPAIERELEQLAGKQPLPEFVYHDEGPLLLELKRSLKAVKLYYLIWQRSAREVVARLHRTHQFDLIHHVTFAGFRYPTAIWGHGVPCIWGPIGGIESVPLRLLPWSHPVSLAHELARNFSNVLQATPIHVLPKRARATTQILASTVEMQQAFARFHCEALVMPTIGLNTRALPAPNRLAAAAGPLKILFVGNLIALKGVDFAIQALKESGTDATFTLVGDGNFREAASELAAKLGLGERVQFRGRLPREEVLKLYQNYDLFMFPSLHDTGGYAVIEAMVNELPVVCLDSGGPALAVGPGCGIKAPPDSRADVVANLASAIRRYDRDRTLLAAHGQAARVRVLEHYDWERKGEQMNAVYADTLRIAAQPEKQAQIRAAYSGVGSFTNLLHRIFSLKGAIVSALVLLIIGMFGFLSMSHLKNEARNIVDDTLPGLSYAGAANANLAQGFNRTLLYVVTDDATKRERLQKEITDFTRLTTEYLDQYQKQIDSKEDRENYAHLETVRDDYLKLRNAIIQMAARNERGNALAAIDETLVPAYNQYKEAGEKILSYEIKNGRVRGEAILRVSTITQFTVAIIGILVFLLGFFFGVFK